MDTLGSVRAVLNDAGVPQAVAKYDAWGVPETTAIAPFGFTGALQQGSDVWLRARWYGAGRGSFGGRDPYQGEAGVPYSMQYYQYGYSNPVSNWDPRGEAPCAPNPGIPVGNGGGGGGRIGPAPDPTQPQPKPYTGETIRLPQTVPHPEGHGWGAGMAALCTAAIGLLGLSGDTPQPQPHSAPQPQPSSPSPPAPSPTPDLELPLIAVLGPGWNTSEVQAILSHPSYQQYKVIAIDREPGTARVL